MNWCNYYTSYKCDLAHKGKATATVNGVEICYDAWNKASQEERNWIEKITRMYHRGLLTKKDFSDSLLGICYHRYDPTFPVSL